MFLCLEVARTPNLAGSQPLGTKNSPKKPLLFESSFFVFN